VSLCFIVCWFPLPFTTCFGLHGHLQVCRILDIFISISLKDSASLLFRCLFHVPFCFIVCWFPLPFTTCFGLHGHLQVCRILHIFKDYASLLFFAAFFMCHSALLSVGFHCLSLHVSAYMAIFKSVGFFIYLRIMLRCFFRCLFHVSFCFIVCWFPLPFTTCFGVYGHLQVCRFLHIFKDSTSLFFSLPFSCVPLLYCLLVSTVFHYMFRPTLPSSSV
jgi:hypothetical protein